MDQVPEIGTIAGGVEEHDPGFWIARASHPVLNFPDNGNLDRIDLEEESFWYRHRNRIILEAIRRHPPPGWIADIGGGNGAVSRYLSATGYPSLLVEPDTAAAREAWHRGAVPVLCATLETAKFRVGSIPAIGLFDVLEHVTDPVEFLSQARQLLAPEGRLYATVPAHPLLWSNEDAHAQHRCRYRTRTLAGELREAGFEICAIQRFFAHLFLPVLLLRTIPSRLGWRPDYSREQIVREHRPPSRLARAMLGALGAIEAGLLRRRLSFPCGTSLLAVALPR